MQVRPAYTLCHNRGVVVCVEPWDVASSDLRAPDTSVSLPLVDALGADVDPVECACVLFRRRSAAFVVDWLGNLLRWETMRS